MMKLNPSYVAHLNHLQTVLTDETEKLREALARCLRHLNGKAHGNHLVQKGKTRYWCNLFCNGTATINRKPLAELNREELMALADAIPRILGMAGWDLEQDIARTRKSVTRYCGGNSLLQAPRSSARRSAARAAGGAMEVGFTIRPSAPGWGTPGGPAAAPGRSSRSSGRGTRRSAGW